LQSSLRDHPRFLFRSFRRFVLSSFGHLRSQIRALPEFIFLRWSILNSVHDRSVLAFALNGAQWECCTVPSVNGPALSAPELGPFLRHVQRGIWTRVLFGLVEKHRCARTQIERVDCVIRVECDTSRHRGKILNLSIDSSTNQDPADHHPRSEHHDQTVPIAVRAVRVHDRKRLATW